MKMNSIEIIEGKLVISLVVLKLKIRKQILMFLLFLILTSCDAVNHLQYYVQNKRNKSIKLHLPSYPIVSSQGEFSVKVDTIIEIQPNEKAWIRTSPMDIDFPWATKKIYKTNPGLCGLELIENDSLIKLGCTKSSWNYSKGCSTLKIE